MREPRFERIPLERAARWIIAAGWVLCIGALIAAVFNAYQDKVLGPQFFDPAGIRGWQRVMNFVQTAVQGLPMALLVVAAGFALRTWAGHVGPATAATSPERRKVELPEAEPFPDSTLFLPPPPPQPERANGTGSDGVVFAKPDDDLWRH
ncbi:MAG: hypothetical protein ACOYMR_07740 [Ilumatobacteraceae bacterium]